MTTHEKKQHKDGVHPTEVTTDDPLDGPCSAATAAKLVAHLGFTEAEALALIATQPATEEELKLADKVPLHAIGTALDAVTTHALVTDPKLELGPSGDDFEPRAARLRVASAAEDKLRHAVDSIHGAARLDASVAQQVLSVVVPIIRTRSRANAKVREVYSSLLAYQHARYPGHHGPRATVADVSPAGGTGGPSGG